MKNNNKGFTLVELLAVIVVLAIVMGIAAVAITNVLDSTRKNAYVASAKQFIAGAKTLVNADEVEIMLGSTNNKYAPKCDATQTTKPIKLSDIRTEGGTNDKSPYGNAIDKASSFVNVKAVYDADTGTCTYEYSVYITDGVYAIGTAAAPVVEGSLNSNSVAVVSAGSGE